MGVPLEPARNMGLMARPRYDPAQARHGPRPSAGIGTQSGTWVFVTDVNQINFW